MALRICTGAYRTSPVDSLYVDSGFPPLSIRREELGFSYLSIVLTSKLNPNYKYVTQPIDRAPTRPRLPKPLEVRLLHNAEEVSLLPPCVEEFSPSKFPPWCGPSINVCPAWGNKKTCCDSELKGKFLQHYVGHNDAISIFTDGSKTSEGVGFSVVTPQLTIKKRLPLIISVFTAELLAVLSALIHVFNNPSGKKYVIHTDCMSVLFSLKSPFSKNPIICKIRDWLVLLANRKKINIQFCWVPSHVGVQGNELADVAAKAATRLAHISDYKVPLLDLKSKIRSVCRLQWQLHWNNLQSNFKLKSIRPSVQSWTFPSMDRRSSIVLTRLRIGHTFLTHKFLMASGAERQVPLCSTCHEGITVKHIFIECPQYTLARRSNLLAGLSLGEILGEDAPIGRIVKFLKEINLFYDI